MSLRQIDDRIPQRADRTLKKKPSGWNAFLIVHFSIYSGLVGYQARVECQGGRPAFTASARLAVGGGPLTHLGPPILVSCEDLAAILPQNHRPRN